MPNDCAIDWWPRQTPKMGTFPAKDLTMSQLMPASLGVQGPGEMMMWSGFRAWASAMVILSLRKTCKSRLAGSGQSWPMHWTRL